MLRLASALLVLAAVALFASASALGAGAPFVTCTLADGELAIQPALGESFGIAHLERLGDAIAAEDTEDEIVPLQCAGGGPTVFNTDRIALDGSFLLIAFDSSGGTFAPGRTGEPDGTSEIEIEVRTRRSYELFVDGTGAADEIHFGTKAGALAVNLNAAGESAPDIDVLAHGRPGPFVGTGAGDDLVTTRGGPEMDGEYTGNIVLNGNGGDDRLLGGRGSQALSGGSGHNLLSGGPDRDYLYGDLGGHDLARCGPGHDKAIVEKRDKVRGCERVKRVRGLPDGGRI